MRATRGRVAEGRNSTGPRRSLATGGLPRPRAPVYNSRLCCRGVAQPGRALRSGRRSRRFKSCLPDQFRRFDPMLRNAESRPRAGFFVPARPGSAAAGRFSRPRCVFPGMQTANDLLVAIAQIGVSLAGFSGLIAALRATTGEWHPRDIWSLSWMLGSSVGALLLALLPLWLALAEGPTPEVFRIACAIAAACMGGFALAMSLAGRRLARRGFPRRVPGVPAALFLLLACAAIVDALGAVGR